MFRSYGERTLSRTTASFPQQQVFLNFPTTLEQYFDYLPKVAMKYTQKSIILFYLPQKLLDIRNAKKQRKADLAKRRTYASQQRMKMITQLVSGRYFYWTLIFMFKMHLY